MTNNTGWIKLHRQILENELYFPDRFSSIVEVLNGQKRNS